MHRVAEDFRPHLLFPFIRRRACCSFHSKMRYFCRLSTITSFAWIDNESKYTIQGASTSESTSTMAGEHLSVARTHALCPFIEFSVVRTQPLILRSLHLLTLLTRDNIMKHGQTYTVSSVTHQLSPGKLAKLTAANVLEFNSNLSTLADCNPSRFAIPFTWGT